MPTVARPALCRVSRKRKNAGRAKPTSLKPTFFPWCHLCRSASERSFQMCTSAEGPPSALFVAKVRLPLFFARKTESTVAGRFGVGVQVRRDNPALGRRPRRPICHCGFLDTPLQTGRESSQIRTHFSGLFWEFCRSTVVIGREKLNLPTIENIERGKRYGKKKSPNPQRP